MIDMTIKHGPNTNPITKMFKLSYMLVNNNIHPRLIKMSFHVSLNISNTLVDTYMKLHKNLDFDGPMCTRVFKCL